MWNIFSKGKVESGKPDKVFDNFVNYIHLSALNIEHTKIENALYSLEPINDNKTDLMAETLCELEELKCNASAQHAIFKKLPLDEKLGHFKKEHLLSLSSEDITSVVDTFSKYSNTSSFPVDSPIPKEDNTGTEQIFLDLTSRMRNTFYEENKSLINNISSSIEALKDEPALKLVSNNKPKFN